MNTPKAFISYSWDDSPHKTWVKEFASRLRKDGIDTTLDQWHAAPGDQLPTFMEKAVRENDFVLMVCTPKYKARYDSRNGGAGYEGDIIQGEVFVRNNHRKFIPILRRGNWEEVAPSALLGAYYIDLRDGSGYTNNYQDLLLTLQGQRPKPPDLGTTTSDEPIRWTLILDGICDDSVKSRVEALAKHLQQLLGDSSLTIEKIQQGSVVVHFRGTRTGFEAMKALFESGKINELAGLKILQICEAGDPEKHGIGDKDAKSGFVSVVYDELHRLAASYLRREQPDHDLQPTDLVHEAYLHLVEQRQQNWQNRAHFLAVSAHVMRQILVDHARRGAAKRGGQERPLSLDKTMVLGTQRSEELVALDEALARLETLDQLQSQIVELRFFGGLTEEEISHVLGVSVRKIKRDWKMAKAWLYAEMTK